LLRNQSQLVENKNLPMDNENKQKPLTPGPVALFGSGETMPNGRKVFKALLERLPPFPEVSLLETPAGFELNSPEVAREIATFIEHHLQNFRPQTRVIPARKRGTQHSPEDPDLLAPLLTSDMIFLGPGSPSYAIRQLKDSLAWEYIIARHHLGAGIALASASTIAISSFALPVYEIYKVGEDIHWLQGLNLFSPYNLSLVFVPHWNNKEGGESLDTSRCFMGKARFQPMKAMLPEKETILGIDEHTGLMIDFKREFCTVIGLGTVTIQRDETETKIPAGESFSIFELGTYTLPPLPKGISESTWTQALEEDKKRCRKEKEPGPEVKQLLAKRKEAREREDWRTSDNLRDQIHQLGWEVRDTPEGQELIPK
jgi:hypothetical protein